MQNTVAFYEGLWDSGTRAYLQEYALLLSQITSIPVEDITNASTLEELSQQYAIPLIYFNSFTFLTIRDLINEYIQGASSSSNIIPPRMFRSNKYFYSQSSIVHRLLNACVLIMTNCDVISQTEINQIKRLFESGLLTSNFVRISQGCD